MPRERDLFGFYYTACLGDVAEQLSTLRNLIERKHFAHGPQSGPHLRVCAMLLVQICRDLAAMWQPDFMQTFPDRPDNDLRPRQVEPLFTEASRQVFTFNYEAIAEGYALVKCGPALDLEEFERIHERAQTVLFANSAASESKDSASFLQFLGDSAEFIRSAIERHLVRLREFRCDALLEIDRAGKVQCRFAERPVLKCKPAGSGRRDEELYRQEWRQPTKG